MSIFNFAANSFFDDDDFALSSVASERLKYQKSNSNHFPLDLDMVETPSSYVIIADVPGVTKDRCHVSFSDDQVIIEGKRKKKVISDEDTYLVSERRNGEFRKALHIPVDADPQLMTAKIEDGLLVITIPRAKGASGAKIIHIA